MKRQSIYFYSKKIQSKFVDHEINQMEIHILIVGVLMVC